MINRLATLLTGLVLAGSAGTAMAQAPAADGLGWRLVRKYCAECHEVRPRPYSQPGADGAPGFAALAADPVKGTPQHLKSVLGGLHSTMPPHHFSDGDIDSIVGYFQGLRPAPKASK